MVVAAHLVHRWARSDGGVGASAAKFVSLPCDLDIATLDTRYGAGVANAIGGVNSNDWHCAPVLHKLNVRPWAVVLLLMLLSLVLLPFLRWKQIARPALIMATEYSVRLRRNYEHPHGCLCCSLSDSRRDSFITCWTEACIECRIRKCARQRLG
jgi:hypothetical protein